MSIGPSVEELAILGPERLGVLLADACRRRDAIPEDHDVPLELVALIVRARAAIREASRPD